MLEVSNSYSQAPLALFLQSNFKLAPPHESEEFQQ